MEPLKESAWRQSQERVFQVEEPGEAKARWQRKYSAEDANYQKKKKLLRKTVLALDWAIVECIDNGGMGELKKRIVVMDTWNSLYFF